MNELSLRKENVPAADDWMDRLKQQIDGRRKYQEMTDIKSLERILGYRFLNKEFLVRALTRKDAVEKMEVDHELGNQEIYATLGDGILRAVLVHKLVEMGYGSKGDITKVKQLIESNVKLAEIGTELEIGQFMLMSKNERGKKLDTKKKPLADTMEAIIGAIFLDGGYGAAEHFISNCRGFMDSFDFPEEQEQQEQKEQQEK